MRGILFGVFACCAVSLGRVQSTYGQTDALAHVKINANYDFGNYKLGEYNKKLIVACSVDGNKDFQHKWIWFHNNDEIQMDNVIPHPFIVSRNLLIISHLNESTVGQYTCKIFNTTQNDQLIGVQEINVVMKPKLKLKYVQTFSVGESVSLKCLVHGVPVPEITWKFGNIDIEPSENVSISTDSDGNSILEIKSIDNRHIGEYHCSGQYSTILPPVDSEACILFNEDDIEGFVKTTSALEQLWASALLSALKTDTELRTAKSRFINALLWLKLTGRWTAMDDRWAEPFRQNMLDSDVAVVVAKADILAASRRAAEVRERNADPNVGEFSVRDEVETVAAAAQLARELDAALAAEADDIKWLMAVIEYRSASRAAAYNRSPSEDSFSITVTLV